MEITHLVTIGCSWTFCQGLESPSTQGWPALVAKQLNIPLVNLALPGEGNDFIHRVSHEYVYRNLPTKSKPLFIVAWSQYWRREEWQKRNHRDTSFNDYAPIAIPEDHSKVIFNSQRALLDNYDWRDFFRRTYLCKLSLTNLFKQYDIPYIMTDYSSDREDAHDFLHDLSYMGDIIDNDPYKIENFYNVARDGEPKLPCGHDGAKTQTTIATYSINEIRRLFPDLSVTNGQFYTLNEFVKTSKYHAKFPEWCKFTL